MSGLYCEVCGKRLSVLGADTMCGAACRQKRARDKRDMLKRSIAAAQHIENITKLLTQDVIDPDKARQSLFEINDALHKLWDKINEKELARREKDAEKMTKKRR